MRFSKVLVGSVVALGLVTTSVSAAEISLLPIDASGTHNIVGNEITLDGGGQRVFLELFISGWSPAELSAFQAVIDSSGYTSGVVGVLTPTTEPCVDNSDCVSALGAGSSCTVPPGSPTRCTAGFIDNNRANYVFASVTDLFAVDVSLPDYRYASTALFATAPDPGGARYAGTLVLDVPVGAVGTFTVGFKMPICAGGDNSGEPCDPDDPDPCPGGGICQSTNGLTDANSNPITPLTLSSAVIIVPCETNANCDDGDACTDDTCELDGTCSNDANYNPDTECCDPTTGGTTPIDDGNECSDDICDPATGVVSHPPFGAGTACGDFTDSECDNPDSCDGAGNCDDNFEAAGVMCGDPTDSECSDPDTCDGSGACVANDELAGTPCGNPADTDCTDPDTCNGTGTCQANDVADGTLCDDTLFCNVDEFCEAGICGGGNPRDCSDGIPCTTDSCDDDINECVNSLDPGFCLIESVCYIEGDLNPANDCEACDTATTATDWSFRSMGSECDDGDACTGTGREGIGVDTCDGAGTCAGVLDPECNDQCPFAVPVIEGQTTGNNDNRGADDVEATCQLDSNNDVWFVYTASCDGTVFVSTTGSMFSPSNDPVLSIYDACPQDGGAEIACDDDSGVGLQAALIFPATAGAMYWIRVAGFEDNSGDLVLNIDLFDDCLIDGVCYSDGALNPDNDCEACIPELATMAWSSRPEGAACGDPALTECDNPDACDGAGVCEANPKPDGTECSDDGNECSFDVCGAGACTHPPRPAGTPCGDPSTTECDTPDSCDGANACLPNYEPQGTPCGDPSETTCDLHDVCTGGGACDDNLAADGTPCDDLDICTDEDVCDTGLCVGSPIPEAPLVVSNGPKHLAVTPLPAGSVAPVALRVTSPDWPCLSKYVLFTGQLVANPDFLVPDDWGTIIVRDPDIVPSSQYVVVAECGSFVSPQGSATTAIFGDIVGMFVNGQWGPPDGRVDVLDLDAIVEAFGNLPTAPPRARADLWGCAPDGVIDVFDMIMVADAFSGFSYQESSGCPVPCP